MGTLTIQKNVFICLIIGIVITFICSFSTHASVVINEVAIQPDQTVELYNTASTSADISSWYIDDSGGTTYFTVPSQTILAPKSCLLFSSDFNFNKSSADVIRLFDNTSPPTSSSAKLIEQYPYVKAPEANYSFSKKTDGGTEWQTSASSLGLFNESLTSCIPTPSPTPSPTPIPTLPSPLPTNYQLQPTALPTDYQNIFISEVYPYPNTNEREWVELYNGNSMQVNLDHWYLDDIENSGSAPKSFSLQIDSNSYATIDIASSMFNNNGDSVRLLNSDKNEKDSMEYGKISQGNSVGRVSFSDDLYCEQEPSKNTVNFSCLSLPSPQISSLPPSTQKNDLLKKTISLPTKQTGGNQSIQHINIAVNSANTSSPQQKGEVLAAQTSESHSSSPIPYLSSVSFSYSLLTIVSIFIKMKNA